MFCLIDFFTDMQIFRFFLIRKLYILSNAGWKTTVELQRWVFWVIQEQSPQCTRGRAMDLRHCGCITNAISFLNAADLLEKKEKKERKKTVHSHVVISFLNAADRVRAFTMTSKWSGRLILWPPFFVSVSRGHKGFIYIYLYSLCLVN